MHAAQIYSPGDVRIDEVGDPEPRPGEALIKVRYVSLASSDLALYQKGPATAPGPVRPILVGHECSGEIVAFAPEEEPALSGDGSGRRRHSSRLPLLRVGDRVCVEPTRACGECDRCRSGKHNLCRRLRFVGQPPEPGTLCEFITVPADRLHPLPHSLTYVEGALVEPVAVAIHAVDLAELQAGDSVAILGAGAVGLSILQVVADRGASVTCVAEPLPGRRKIAERLSPTCVIDPTTEDLAGIAAQYSGGAGMSVVFDTSGTSDALRTATTLVGNGGSVVLVGLPDDDQVSLPAATLRGREIAIHTVRGYRNTFPAALTLIATGRTQTRLYASCEFPLDNAAEAFEAATSRPDEVIRALIRVPATPPIDPLMGTPTDARAEVSASPPPNVSPESAPVVPGKTEAQAPPATDPRPFVSPVDLTTPARRVRSHRRRHSKNQKRRRLLRRLTRYGLLALLCIGIVLIVYYLLPGA